MDTIVAATEPDQAELRLWLRLLTCTSLIEREVRARMRREFDMTLPRFDVLAQLDRAADGLSMGELSDRLMVSAGNITGLIDRLAQEGLVARGSRPDDRRTVHVRLTDKGKQAFDQMTPTHHGWIADMLAGLDRTDRKALYDLLGRLKTSISGDA
ncbi:MAG: MarR family transcriptional regulator [Alphaproteobacteria bacterium]